MLSPWSVQERSAPVEIRTATARGPQFPSPARATSTSAPSEPDFT